MADSLDKIISDLSKEELEALQAKVLGESLKGNRYLSETFEGGNLETRSKTIIGAINDIFTQNESIRTANAAFLDEFNAIIGNRKGKAVDQSNYTDLMKRITGDVKNFYAALIQIWDTADDSMTRANYVNDQMEILLDKLKGTTLIGETQNIYEDILYDGPKFSLACTPSTQDSVSIFINGVHYPNDCFSFSDDYQTIEWLCTDSEFAVVAEYNVTNEYNPLRKYYRLNGSTYEVVGSLTKAQFDDGVYYEPNLYTSDKVLVRYSSSETAHRSYYQTLYNISLINSVGVSIAKNPYDNNTYTNNYDFSGMSTIMNKNLVGNFEYDNSGKVRIEISAKEGSTLFTLSEKNWDRYADAARVFVGGDSTINSFSKFCNAIYGTESNDKSWLSFFGIEIGDYGNIYVISDKTKADELAITPADRDWFYGWDDDKSANEKALKMTDKSYNPYLDLTTVYPKLVNKYESD